MSEKWITISEHLRTVLLLAFAFPIMALYFEWFNNKAPFTNDRLNDLKNIAIILYIIIYVLELRLKLKIKSDEIALLKTRLQQNEK